ncbi:MAG: tail fiber domain-containing protein [Bacteroidales bacterium]|nr:tail fiber domain-containing protein [Bacteroidales bacterium]
MAQYDIVFAINTALSGVLYEERSIKLTKGELLVGTNSTPTSLPAGANGSVLIYDNTQASGFNTTPYGRFSDLYIDGETLRNAAVPNTMLYLGEDDLIELVASTSSVYGGGTIDLRSNALTLRAPNVTFTDLPGTGAHLTIDANGNLSRTTISGGGSSLWSVNGADIYRSSKVGIKNTAPTYDLDVTGTARVTTGIYTPKIYGSSDTNTYLDWVSADQLRIVVGGLEMMRFVESTNDRIGVKLASPAYDFDVNGDIHASGDIVSNSDIRLKKNIFPLPDIAGKVKQLRPVMFDWKETDKSDIGLIAQEVEKVFPCLVRTDDEGFKSVNYQKLTVLLLKALQEIM